MKPNIMSRYTTDGCGPSGFVIQSTSNLKKHLSNLNPDDIFSSIKGVEGVKFYDGEFNFLKDTQLINDFTILIVMENGSFDRFAIYKQIVKLIKTKDCTPTRITFWWNCKRMLSRLGIYL